MLSEGVVFMSIYHAILGMLSYKPLTGYDLKKIMQESSFMHWSGNNNQIYKALLELNDNGFVTNEVRHQDHSPSKKIYTITDDGLLELKKWLKSSPDTPEIKKTFLVQLAWANQLSNAEIEAILDQYEQEIKGNLAIEQSRKNQGVFSPDRTPRETVIWSLIHENIFSLYINELNWIEKVRQAIRQFDAVEYDENTANGPIKSEENEKMKHYKVIENSKDKYLLLEAGGNPIQTEQDGLELISVCAEHGTNLLLIQGERLSDDFMRLKTGVAGAILQKFMNYNIKAVAVLDEGRTQGRFKEFLTESNSGSMFRAYKNYADAENWLLQ
jgi:DNA-binding PadR family transcriptional regulator